MANESDLSMKTNIYIYKKNQSYTKLNYEGKNGTFAPTFSEFDQNPSMRNDLGIQTVYKV